MESQEIYNIIIATTIILVVLGLFIFLFVIMYQKRNSEYRKNLLSQKIHFEHSLLQAQLEIQEQTFKTISQEIHDNIGQMLSLAKLNLSKFELDRQHSDEAVLDAKDLVGKAVQSLRDLAKTLNTETITEIGLLKSVELELNIVKKTTGINTNMITTGPPARLEPNKELIVFRIVQEALHNSIKHAQASEINIEGRFENEHLQILISDNGKGFNQENGQIAQGSGLRNMKSRSKAIQAQWILNTQPGQGTLIQLIIPLN